MNLKLTREQRLAQRYLNGYKGVQDTIESGCQMVAMAVSLREPVAHAGEIVAAGANHDKMDRAVMALDEAVEQVTAACETLRGRFMEVEGFVSEVQRRDVEAGRALRLAHLDGLGVDGMADEMGCSRKTAYDRYRRGLDIAFDLLGE